jgi:cysteine synthase A
MALVLPPELTGVSHADRGADRELKFPTGAHKVGPAYSIVVEKQVHGEIVPGKHRLVFPSTGNFGIGGSWVGPRMGYESSLVVLPEDMSPRALREDPRLRRRDHRDPGQRVQRQRDLRQGEASSRRSRNAIINQFAEFGNYRFHAAVTPRPCRRARHGARAARASAAASLPFVSAMGSAGTIGAGDALKERSAP